MLGFFLQKRTKLIDLLVKQDIFVSFEIFDQYFIVFYSIQMSDRFSLI